MKKALSLLLCLVYLMLLVPSVTLAADSLVEIADAIRFEMISDHEPLSAVTKNLNLNLSLPAGVTAEFYSSDSSVLDIGEGVGRIKRAKYINKNVTLTMTLSKNGEASISKEFDITVLNEAATLYMAETFYYPGNEGELVQSLEGNTITPGTTPPTTWGKGWSSTHEVDADDSTDNGKQFKSIIHKRDGEYMLKSYKGEKRENYNYTRYVFGTRPVGKTDFSMKMMFDEPQFPQIYVFWLWANYMQDDGGLERAQALEIKLYRYENGTTNVYMQNGRIIPLVDVSPEKGEWFDFKISFDVANQQYDVYYNDEKINAEPQPFYTKGKEGYELCYNMNDFQFNSFRTNGYSGIYIDDMVAKTNTDEIEKHYLEHSLADMLNIEEIATSIEGVFNPMAVENDFYISIENSDVLSYMNDNGLSIEWIEKDDNINITENTVEIKRGEIQKNATLVARITKDGQEGYVDKPFELVILPAEDAMQFNYAYTSLREETLTSETRFGITEDLTLPTFEGINITWESSRPGVIDKTGKVTRGETDETVTLRAKLESENKVYSGNKDFEFKVLAKDYNLCGAENFYHEGAEGKLVSESGIPYWSDLSSNDEPKLINTIEKETDGNFTLKCARPQANNSNYNFIKYSFPKKIDKEGRVEFRFKFHSDNPTQIYMFQLYGTKVDDEGNKITGNTRDQIAEIQFYYSGEGSRVRNMGAGARDLTFVMPKDDKWYTAAFEIDNATQTFDFYIDDKKLNSSPLKYYSYDSENEFINALSFQANPIRSNSGGNIYIDDMTVSSKTGLLASSVLFDNGEYRTTETGEIISGNMDAKILLYNGQDKAVEGTVFFAAYKDKALSWVKSMPVSLAAHETGKKIVYTDLPLADNKHITLKTFFMDLKTLYPEMKNEVVTSRYDETVEPDITYDPVSERSYYSIDLYGQNAIHAYFTMQGWSADSTKFYFWTDDSTIYEYDIVEKKITFIDRALRDYLICTTQLNNLFYVNDKYEIIKMNCETHVREYVTTIPSEYLAPPAKCSMLQVTQEETHLSLDWGAGTSGFATKGEETQFVVYDIINDEWNAKHKFGFDIPWYAPNHLQINLSEKRANLVMFAHEGNGSDGTGCPDRVWVMNVDTGEAYNAFVQKKYSDYETGEIPCHETWMKDGDKILFCKSGKIGYNGLVMVDVDGKNRRYISNGYSHLHAGASPVDERWIISDTEYNGKDTYIVLTDALTGDAYLLAKPYQTGANPGHGHPHFSQDGKKIFFGFYNENDVVSIGWTDISDIIEVAPEVTVESLSDNCTVEVIHRDGEVSKVTELGENAFKIPSNKQMRVQANVRETESAAADIEITYLDNGTGDITLCYYTYGRAANGYNYELKKNTKTITKTNTGKFVTKTISLSDINLENMELLSSDFTIKAGSGGDVIKNVKVTIK